MSENELKRKNLKIAVLGTRGFPGVQGGVERHCEELYPRLSLMGCQISVYARRAYINPQIMYYKGVEIISLWTPKKKSLEAIIHTFIGVMHIAFQKERFDILHIHAIGPSFLSPLARFLGLKVVVTNHGPDYDRQKWGYIAKVLLHLGEYLGTRFASVVIAVSQYTKKLIKEKYNRDVIYIPNGVNIPKKTPAGRVLSHYDLKAGKYILAVGRYVPEKGFHDLLDAFKMIDVDWKLVIAGGADHEDDYSKSLEKQGEDDPRVVMTGFITGMDLSEIYSNAGFLVLPSYHEGLPITILEAMSYGLPVLASNIPANMELITDENCTFPPGDINTMKRKLLEFIEIPRQKDVIAISKKRIENEFNWDRIAKETFKLYVTVTSRATFHPIGKSII